MSGFQNNGQKAQAKRLRRTMTSGRARPLAPPPRPSLHGPLGSPSGPIGPFIVDFLIPHYRLIIEADGAGHGSQRDMDRDRWLADKGFRVLRLGNQDILKNLPACLDTIAAQTPRH